MGLSTTIAAIPSFVELRNELKTLYKLGKDELKYLLDDGLISYTASKKEKFEQLNTFLYQREKVNFYKIYFPLNLEWVDVNENIYTINVNDDLSSLFENRACITIIGSAGSGKSMLMKHIFLHYLTKEAKIPLFIELRNLNAYDGSFYDFIVKSCFTNRLTPNNNILERLFENGKFLFLLDGYDELHEKTKRKIRDEISDFIDKYRANNFIITSRPGTYIETLPRFNNLYVSELEGWQIKPFIERQLSIIDDNEILIGNMMDVINNPKNEDYEDYMRNPLLLTMFIFTFKERPEMPQTKSRFYYNVFDTLTLRHDSVSKVGDIHKRKTNLKTEDFEVILKWFSLYSYFEGYFNFERKYLVDKLKVIIEKCRYDVNIEDLIYDLSVSISILLVEGQEYKFPHRSLQEYFVAKLMSEVSPSRRIDKYTDLYLNNGGLEFENLWILSKELDPYYFSLFLLNQYNNLLDVIVSDDPKQQITNYLKIFCNNVTFFKSEEYYIDMGLSYEWNNHKILAFHDQLKNYFFRGFTYNYKLQNCIENSDFLQYNTSYTLAVSKIDFLLKCKEISSPIVECEEFIRVSFTKEVNDILFDYFNEVGLNLFVDNIIYKFKSYKKSLDESINKKLIQDEDLFDF